MVLSFKNLEIQKPPIPIFLKKIHKSSKNWWFSLEQKPNCCQKQTFFQITWFAKALQITPRTHLKEDPLHQTPKDMSNLHYEKLNPLKLDYHTTNVQLHYNLFIEIWCIYNHNLTTKNQ